MQTKVEKNGVPTYTREIHRDENVNALEAREQAKVIENLCSTVIFILKSETKSDKEMPLFYITFVLF
jgi:hypothetical protein